MHFLNDVIRAVEVKYHCMGEETSLRSNLLENSKKIKILSLYIFFDNFYISILIFNLLRDLKFPTNCLPLDEYVKNVFFSDTDSKKKCLKVSPKIKSFLVTFFRLKASVRAASHKAVLHRAISQNLANFWEQNIEFSITRNLCWYTLSSPALL